MTLLLICCLAVPGFGRLPGCSRAVRSYLAGFPIDLAAVDLPPFVLGHQIRLLVNGDEILPALLEQIASSRRVIRVQVMLLHPDAAGQQLVHSLVEAARRGVEVQLSFDYKQTVRGTYYFPLLSRERAQEKRELDGLIASLHTAGVQVLDSGPGIGRVRAGMSQQASETIASLQEATCVGFNHADHRKIFIFDDQRAIVAGTNVGNAYLYLRPADLGMTMKSEAQAARQANQPEAWEKWLDAAVLVEGPAVAQLVVAFNLRWEAIGGESRAPVIQPAAAGATQVQVLSQRPGAEVAAASHLQLVADAQDEIWVASPYLAYEPMLQALAAAAQRGVHVVVVYPGDVNDVAISARIARASTARLMQAGVQVYENNRRMAHAKVMVVDRRWVQVGSFNLDYRSFNHNYELNLLIDSPELAAETHRRVFAPYLTMAEHLDLPYSPHLPLPDRLLLPFT